jgi:pectate lyase
MKFSVLDPTLPFSETLVPVSSTSLTRVTGYVAYTFLALSGVGLRVYQESNVIIRNLVISEVLAEAGDAIGIQEATKVWIDHLDLSSNLDHDKD